MRNDTTPSTNHAALSLHLHRATGLMLVNHTPKGRGIFASKPISNHQIIEVCPVLLLNPAEDAHLRRTILHHYTYNWPWKDGSASQAIILGLGSMFNHSTNRQNVAWTRDLEKMCVVYTALRDIEAGEELCISYGNGRLWFKDADVADSAEPDDDHGLDRIDLA